MARNAQLEGVADRVEVRDDDARALSFVDASFDVVVSMLRVHNIDDGDGRAAALREMVRVLRPGGTVVISDLAGVEAYATELRGLGLSVTVGATAWGTFPPQRVLVGRKPA
jgi:ubiquinone/menaquinone biosynthesis C-methylase UbiE